MGSVKYGLHISFKIRRNSGPQEFEALIVDDQGQSSFCLAEGHDHFLGFVKGLSWHEYTT